MLYNDDEVLLEDLKVEAMAYEGSDPELATILRKAASRIIALGTALANESYRNQGMKPWMRAGQVRDNPTVKRCKEHSITDCFDCKNPVQSTQTDPQFDDVELENGHE